MVKSEPFGGVIGRSRVGCVHEIGPARFTGAPGER